MSNPSVGHKLKTSTETATNGLMEDESCNDDETSSVGSWSTNDNVSRSETPIHQGLRGKKGKRGRRKIVKPVNSKLTYNFSCYVKEDHAATIFACSFNLHLKEGEPLIFASVGKNRVNIYQCTDDYGLKILQSYADPDGGENYYTCAWSHEAKTGNSVLAVGGLRGVVRIISPALRKCVRLLAGHGNAINELKFHPRDPNLLLSVSKDHTLRLWNIRTQVCIAIFGSVEGHRDEVLSADFNLKGDRIMSGGMDHSLKLWRLDKPEMKETIRNSNNFKAFLAAPQPFTCREVHFPDFSTRDVHKNYVDCVRWFGDFILSKSCESNIVCWKPGRLDDKELRSNESSITMLHRFDFKNGDIWFVRFSLDYWQKVMAVGNTYGKTFVWDLDLLIEKGSVRVNELTHPKCSSAVRQTSLSRDGDVLICVCDDGTIWRWDRSAQ